MGKRRLRSRRTRPDERRRSTSRLKDLAAEFGISSAQLSWRLQELGIFVWSDLSPLKPEQVALIRTRWARGRPRNAIRRINRLLAPKGFAIRVPRSRQMRINVGRDWYVEDVERNAISHRYEKFTALDRLEQHLRRRPVKRGNARKLEADWGDWSLVWRRDDPYTTTGGSWPFFNRTTCKIRWCLPGGAETAPEGADWEEKAARAFVNRGTGEVRWSLSEAETAPEGADWEEKAARVFVNRLGELKWWLEEAPPEGGEWEKIPALTHGDHHDIFRDWVMTLPRDLDEWVKTPSIGGTLQKLDEADPGRGWRSDWREFHDDKLKERATAWLCERGFAVKWVQKNPVERTVRLPRDKGASDCD
jgi:hypothetical protein